MHLPGAIRKKHVQKNIRSLEKFSQKILPQNKQVIPLYVYSHSREPRFWHHLSGSQGLIVILVQLHFLRSQGEALEDIFNYTRQAQLLGLCGMKHLGQSQTDDSQDKVGAFAPSRDGTSAPFILRCALTSSFGYVTSAPLFSIASFDRKLQKLISWTVQLLHQDYHFKQTKKHTPGYHILNILSLLFKTIRAKCFCR